MKVSTDLSSLATIFLALSAATTATKVATFTIPIPFLSAINSPSNPLLVEYATEQNSAKLNLRLDIGKWDSDVRLPIDSLQIRLDSTGPRPGKGENGDPPHPVPLPGADGPNPGLSSGAMALDIMQSGTFVTLDGTQTVPLTDGAWEIVWRYGNPAGSIIFAFRVSYDVKRNEAKLPGGRLYVSYPLWTSDGISESRKHVADVQAKAEQYTTERDEAISRAEECFNPLMKALHFREAFAAQERLDFSGVRTLQEVPEASDLIGVGGNLLLCRYGTVWTKDGNFFGGDHELLGSSTISSVESAELKC